MDDFQKKVLATAIVLAKQANQEREIKQKIAFELKKHMNKQAGLHNTLGRALGEILNPHNYKNLQWPTGQMLDGILTGGRRRFNNSQEYLNFAGDNLGLPKNSRGNNSFMDIHNALAGDQRHNPAFAQHFSAANRLLDAAYGQRLAGYRVRAQQAAVPAALGLGGLALSNSQYDTRPTQ